MAMVLGLQLLHVALIEEFMLLDLYQLLRPNFIRPEFLLSMLQ
jgi:hypothetical protein